jgi:MJ1316 RNA cyclic group end recognition domain
MQLIHAFFATYADWDWARDAVTIPGVNDTSTYTRAVGREPMVIMSIERPMLNIVQNANQHTLDAIISSFKHAHRHLVEGAHWSNVYGLGGICGNVFKSTFLPSHESYIKLDLLLWGNSTAKARAWVSYVESRLPQVGNIYIYIYPGAHRPVVLSCQLLAQLQTSYPDWSVRLWPNRLVDANNSGRLATGLQSFYLLGLSPRKPASVKRVEAFLLSIENQLRRNEKFYDSTEMFVAVSKVSASHLPESITTPPAWPDNGIDPYDDSSDEEEVAETSDAAFAPVSSKQFKQARTQHLKGRNTPCIPAPKLRTSSDVYYRILWDHELDAEDYLIGYEDRFSGLKEMPVTNWKRDVEHEDFVGFDFNKSSLFFLGQSNMTCCRFHSIVLCTSDGKAMVS